MLPSFDGVWFTHRNSRLHFDYCRNLWQFHLSIYIKKILRYFTYWTPFHLSHKRMVLHVLYTFSRIYSVQPCTYQLLLHASRTVDTYENTYTNALFCHDPHTVLTFFWLGLKYTMMKLHNVCRRIKRIFMTGNNSSVCSYAFHLNLSHSLNMSMFEKKNISLTKSHYVQNSQYRHDSHFIHNIVHELYNVYTILHHHS